MISRKNIFELENRSKIFQYILDNPGLHQRELCRQMNIPKTTMNYHLNFLLKKDFIVSKLKGNNNNYFVLNNVGNGDKKFIGIVRNDALHKIILYFLIFIIGSRSSISKTLEKSPNTIGYHLRKLRKEEIIEIAPFKNGLVERVNKGVMEHNTNTNETMYRLKNAHQIYDLILTNNKSFFKDNLTSEIFYLIKESKAHGPLAKRISQTDKRADIVFDVFFEIFPHPYHP